MALSCGCCYSTCQGVLQRESMPSRLGEKLNPPDSALILVTAQIVLSPRTQAGTGLQLAPCRRNVQIEPRGKHGASTHCPLRAAFLLSAHLVARAVSFHFLGSIIILFSIIRIPFLCRPFSAPSVLTSARSCTPIGPKPEWANLNNLPCVFSLLNG